MLAYVFWHRSAAGVPDEEYRRMLVAFHEALRRSAPAGFQRSWILRTEGAAAWLGSERRSYEDWYLLDGAHVLDPLNDAAVSGRCKEPHDDVARRAASGAGGLYQLHSGAPLPWTHVVWLSKPAGAQYQEFYQRLQAWTTREDVSLWRRQMVLGPTSEFCLVAPVPVSLPAECTPIVTMRSLIWPL